MTILGIGLPEISLIVILALILLGPKDMVKAGRTLGRTLRTLVMSPAWQAMRSTGKEIQQLPTKLMREAGLEEIEAELRKTGGHLPSPNQKSPGPFQSVESQLFTIPTPDSPPNKPDANPQTPPAAEQ